MRLELPIPPPVRPVVLPADLAAGAGPGAGSGGGGAWRRIELGQGPESTAASPEGAESARYYERIPEHIDAPLGQPESAPTGGRAAPCLLIVSPLLPLPRSLAALVAEALAGEPDFRLDWKWPILTPRAGPWELVVQMCVGTSQETGHVTGRIYLALDAGSGAYLLVCVDRDPQKLAARQKELLALVAGARLHRARISAEETATRDQEAAAAADAGLAPATPATPTEIIPPQQPPPELYLKEALFSYLTD